MIRTRIFFSLAGIVILLLVGAFVQANLSQVRRFFGLAGGEIDVLDYFISDHAVGRDSSPKSTGVTQFVGSNFSYYVKTWVGAYELHTWDNNFIYLNQDTSIGPGNIPANVSNAKSYKFEPGVWAKRFMQVGESVEMPANQLTWYDANCNVITSWTHPYTMTLESHTSYDVGGDLGTQDVIIIRYQYGTSYENFFYSREWGWIRWEEYVNGSMTRSVDFNSISSDLLEPDPVCGAPQPPAIPTQTPPTQTQPPSGNTLTRVDDKDSGITYVGPWGEQSSGGYDFHYAPAPLSGDTVRNYYGANASYTFTGNLVTYTAYALFNRGWVEIKIDGNLVDTVNYSDGIAGQRTWTSPSLSCAQHTINIAQSEDKAGTNGGRLIALDYLEYRPCSPGSTQLPTTTSPPETSSNKCQGNLSSSPRCFDCRKDGTPSQINILDFSCFSKYYGKKV